MNKAWHTAAIETLDILRERFPCAFAPQRQAWRAPLKIKIRDDILAAAPDLDAKSIARAMRFYVLHPAYQRSLVPGAKRIDLDGKRVGIVTEIEAAHAQRKPKPEPAALRSEPAAPAPKPEPKKRLSLSDLKAAAAQRRAAV
jgi:ProP effector